MKLAVYSTKQYDKKYLQHVNEAYGFELEFFDFLLSEKTAKRRTAVKASAFLLTMTAVVRCWKS
jgi:lactate dehydrogenase-like 2-hydroxyacid dehydrogenase